MSESELDDKTIQAWKDRLDGMSQLQLAHLQRFAPSDHPVFDNRYPLYEHFQEKFKEKGGMTPSVSKSIGWDAPKF